MNMRDNTYLTIMYLMAIAVFLALMATAAGEF